MVGEHGKRWTYCKGCRCDDCRAANSAYSRDYWRRSEKARLADRRRHRSEAYKKQKRAYLESEGGKRKHNEACARWVKTEKGKAAYGSQKHRRRTKELEQFVEAVDRYVVFDRDEGLCGLCGKAVSRDDFHVDHIVPIARGGEESYGNVQVAHPSCNRKKGATRR